MISAAIASVVFGKLLVPGQILLRFHPPVGKSYKYKVSMSMGMEMGGKASPMGMNSTSDILMSVISSANNLTTVKTTMSNAHVILPPNSPMAGMKSSIEKQMAAAPITMKIDPLYHIHDSGGVAGSAALSNLESLAFPEKALKVGDSWSSSLDMSKVQGAMGSKMPGMTMTGSIPIKFKLIGVAKGAGGLVANIQMTMKGQMNMGMQGQNIPVTVDSSGTFQVDVATGMTAGFKMSSLNTTKFGANSMVQKMTQSMVRY